MRRIRGKFIVGVCEFQAASMADLGFLLLVFFIVTTVFAIEQGIPLILPGRARTVTRLKESEVLEIRVGRDGSVEAAGRLIGVDAVRSLVEQRIAHHPEVVVVLMTAPEASYGRMVDVLDQIKLARCRRISLQSMD